MKKSFASSKRSVFASVSVCVLAFTTGAGALDNAAADDAAADVADQLVVTGVRGQARTVAEAAVPIDVFDEKALEAVSFTDANDILQTLVPSYTLARQPISDGATFVRPASLRGLPTDKTLVLVNSKRRHRAALVSIGGSGTQGPDIATIPSIALSSVEVLRDGAAAQYGSDAIAGVINFILKDDPEGLTFTSQVGEFYEGDGFEYILAANGGFALGEAGFINASFEYSHADATNRAVQYCESYFCVDTYAATPGNEAYAAAVDGIETVQPWGRPNSEAYRSFVNVGYTFSEKAELYGFGNYSQSTADGNFFYRYPNNGTIEDLRLEGGSIYSPLSIFPGGFTPKFSGKVIDYSAVGGVRGDLGRGFTYDISGRFGHSEIQYSLEETINPSLGPDSPTTFEPGDLINEEMQFQVDLSQSVELGLAEPLVIAFGGTYFKESYELVEGEPLSYAAGPYAGADPWDFCTGPIPTAVPTPAGALVPGLDCTDPDDAIYNVVGVGSNGFPGYSPGFSGKYKRNSNAVYVDVSADVTTKLFLQAAARYEDYSDFGSQLIYKVAGRYELFDFLAVRGSLGTGFRAPTPGQQGTTNVSTRVPDGIPVATGLFPASSAVALALGATPLEPETSDNYTAGVTATFFGVGLSIDFYKIDLKDRVNAISTQSVSANPGAGAAYDNYLALVSAGVAGAESIGGVFYFTNAVDTVTRGFDIVATYDMDWFAGATSLTAAVNYNETEFDGPVSALFNAESQFDFLYGEPAWRGVFTVVHEIGDLDMLVRANYYGAYENADGSGTIAAIQEFSPEVFFDVELSYDFLEDYRLSLGARNVFDNYPDASTLPGDSCCGRVYRSDSLVDWQGGYYYAKFTASF